MLSLTIDRPYPARSAYDLVVSFTALDSPHLKTITATSGTRRVWCVVERCGQLDMDELLRCDDPAASSFALALTFDGVALLVSDGPSDVAVHIIRTSHATVPLYLSANQERLTASWDFLACAGASSNRGNIDACRRFILEGPTIATSTIIEDVSLLVGGQVATWNREPLQIDGPRVVPRYAPSLLSPGAQATEMFLELIAGEIAPRLSQSLHFALELSGGSDSSCVGAAAAGLTDAPLNTYGLTHVGVSGAQQTARRAELIDRFGFADVSICSKRCRPFAIYEEGAEHVRRVPSDELYRHGIESCLDALHRSPDLVLTGIGGDELTLLADDEIVSDVSGADRLLFGDSVATITRPQTVPSVSAVESAFCRADMFLSRGIWPLNPLISPAVVHFCQMLPDGLKRARILNRIALARLGLSDYFLFPPYRENFGEVYRNDLRRFDFGTFLRTALIHEFGIVELPALLRQHVQFVNDGACEIPLICFANAVRLEAVLRRLTA